MHGMQCNDVIKSQTEVVEHLLTQHAQGSGFDPQHCEQTLESTCWLHHLVALHILQVSFSYQVSAYYKMGTIIITTS